MSQQHLTSLVTAFWQHHELSQGGREQRFQAEARSWASDAVEEALQAAPQADTLALLDALLEAPGADPCHLGAGALEDLLARDGARWQETVAQRCRTSALWRQAVWCVWLDVPLPLLADYLPPPPLSPAEPRPASSVPKKTSRDRGQIGRRSRRAPR